MSGAGDRILDFGLLALTTESDRVFLCSSDPATYTDASTTNVGSKLGSRGSMFYALASVTGGRMASLAGFNDGNITANGTANFVIVADSINQTILVSEPLVAPQVVKIGGKFAINVLDVIIGKSSQPQASNFVVSSPVIGTPVFAKLQPNVSNITVASPQFGVPILIWSGANWFNQPVPAMAGSFVCEYDATPSALSLDVVTGLSNGVADTYSLMACAVLFTNTSNVIQVRNGGAYAADSVVPYTAGQQFHVKIVGNVLTHTYSVFVKPLSQAEVQIASNYAFRTEQNAVTSLNYFSRNATDTGTVVISNLTFNSLVAQALVVGRPVLNNWVFPVAGSLATSSPVIGAPSIIRNVAVHGQDIAAANVGRAGAAALALPNYSPTLTTLGATNYSANATVRNTRFTGNVQITGGSVTFEYCQFVSTPAAAVSAVRQYNNGSASGNTIFNYCDFDSGLRGTQGNNETAGFQAGERGSGNAATVGQATSFKLYRCQVQGYANAVCIHKWLTNTASSVTECLLQNLTSGGGSHVDGIEYYSSDNVTVERCRVLVPDGYSNIQINTMDIGFLNPGSPIAITDNYFAGGGAPIIAVWTDTLTENYPGANFLRNVKFKGNRLGDKSVYGRICHFNKMDVTYDETYADANPGVIYWASSNVWAPNGEGVTSPAFGDDGSTATAGLPHTPGAFVDERNFFGGAIFVWNGNVVPSGSAIPVITPQNYSVSFPIGTDVLVGHVDATNQPTSYAIVSGDPNNYFAIYASGNIRTSNTIAVPAGNYNLSVTASNAAGTSSAAASNIQVGANTAPVVVNSTLNLSIPATTGQVVGTVPTTGGSPTGFAITVGNSSGYFLISSTGVITVSSAGATGLTVGTYNLTVQASNSVGSSTGSVTVNAAAAGKPQVISVNFVKPTIPVTQGQVIGTVTATQSTTAWTAVADSSTLKGHGAYFAVSNAGQITVTAAGASFYLGEPVVLTLTATNAVGTSNADQGYATIGVPINAVTGVAFPNPATIGFHNHPDFKTNLNPNGAGVLAVFSGPIVSGTAQNHTVYKFKDIVNGISVTQQFVDFIGCRFQQNNANAFYSLQISGNNNSFQYCSFVPAVGGSQHPIPMMQWPSAGAGMGVSANASAAVRQTYMIPAANQCQYGIGDFGTSNTISNCDIWGFANAGQNRNGNGGTWSSCWVHDARYDATFVDHSDGIGYLDSGTPPDNVTISNCTIASIGNTNGIAWQGASSSYDGHVMSGNYTTGWWASIPHGSPTPTMNSTQFVDNVFGSDIAANANFIFVSDITWTSPNNVWRRNKVRLCPGAPQDGVWFSAGDDGKFIWSNGSRNVTDYTG